MLPSSVQNFSPVTFYQPFILFILICYHTNALFERIIQSYEKNFKYREHQFKQKGKKNSRPTAHDSLIIKLDFQNNFDLVLDFN